MTFRHLLIASLTALGACRLGSSGPDDVTVRLSSVQQAVPQGGSGDLTITVTNGSARAISIHVADCPLYLLSDDKGKVVGPFGLICPAVAPPPIVVQPGETYSRASRWFADGISTPGFQGAQPPLPAGRYLLTARVAVERALRVVTSTVQITPAND